MYDPDTYEKNKDVPDAANLVFVPKLINAMSWKFFRGNILDYGCGPGSTGYKLILPYVECTDSQMYSTDISLSMVQFAQKKFPHPRIHYGAAGSLPDNFPFANMQFDKIFAVNVFHFVPDINVMISSLFDILKPGGELGFTTTTVKGMKVLKLLAETETWAPFMKNYADYWPIWSVYDDNPDPEQHFKNIFLENTGFEKILFEYTNVVATKPAEAVVETTISAIPSLPDIPKELHGKLKEDIYKIYAKMFGTPVDNPTITLNNEYICAVLRKPMDSK